MAKLRRKSTINRTASVAGTHIRYDVPTKCSIVNAVLSNTYSSKRELNDYINELAASIDVNPVTVKMWISKYQNTFSLGMHLEPGTMSYTFTVLQDDNIDEALKALLVVRKRIESIRLRTETTTIAGVSAKDLRSIRTPQEILDMLISNNKH